MRWPTASSMIRGSAAWRSGSVSALHRAVEPIQRCQCGPQELRVFRELGVQVFAHTWCDCSPCFGKRFGRWVGCDEYRYHAFHGRNSSQGDLRKFVHGVLRWWAVSLVQRSLSPGRHPSDRKRGGVRWPASSSPPSSSNSCPMGRRPCSADVVFRRGNSRRSPMWLAASFPTARRQPAHLLPGVTP